MKTSVLRRALLCGALAMAPWLPATADSVAVVIEGVDGELLDNVRAALPLVRYEGDATLRPARIEQLHEDAVPALRRSLQPFGFYRPDISAQLIPPSAPAGSWRASYRIEPGPPLPIAAVGFAVEGPGSSDDELLAELGRPDLVARARFDHQHYEAEKDRLLATARRLGYPEAHYSTHRVEVDLDRYAADIGLVLQTGRRHVVGPIRFEPSRFAERYLERHLVVEPGMRFNRDLLSRQRRALAGSGHFSDVAVEAGTPAEGEQAVVPLTVRLTPFKANRYRGRLGWGTETGLGGQLDWTRRHFGRHGHRFNLGVTAVEERERFAGDFRYQVPVDPLGGRKLEFGIRHESKDLNFSDVDLEQGGATRIATNLAAVFLDLPRTRLGPFDMQAAAGINFAAESYDVFEVLFGNLPDDDQQFIIDEIIGREAYATLTPDFRATIPELRVSLSHADSQRFIRRGDYLGLRLLGSHEKVGSNIGFWQARLNHWSIFPVGEHNRLLLRSALGYSEADDREVLGVTFNQMPEFYEFRGGGARNIRGYGFETLFPEDGITGGKHQVVASVEYEQRILPDWSAAVFVDGGDAFNDPDDFQTRIGAGIGVRWRSPFGPARLDLGFPLDDADSAFQLYITVGPEF
jgi:translocation and assembly module TamA